MTIAITLKVKIILNRQYQGANRAVKKKQKQKQKFANQTFLIKYFVWPN